MNQNDINIKFLIWSVIAVTLLAWYGPTIPLDNHNSAPTNIVMINISTNQPTSNPIINNRNEKEDNPHINTNWKPVSIKKEKECLALNMYFEARNQSIKDAIAVGLVTINRVISPSYPDNICNVVWQKNKTSSGKWVAQFSWTLDGKPDVPADNRAWKRAQRLANAMIAGGSLFAFHDFTNGATHYHADYVNPYWVKFMDRTGHYGSHIFYRDERVAAR